MECLHPNMISGIIKNALENSGNSKEVLKNLQTQIDQSKTVTGKVHAVITNLKERKIMVGISPFEWFLFPPNGNNFEAELIRAQEAERIVTVNYYKDPNNVIMITDVWLFSKEAYPDKKTI